MNQIKVGDQVICILNGIRGTVTKQYYPTACEQQTMILCADGRLYHAPTRLFRKAGAQNDSVPYQ